jgi:hypothetical protein
VSTDLLGRDGAEIIALVRPWSDVLNRFEWNKTTETFQLNDEAFSQALEGLSEEEAHHASRREWNNHLPEEYQEFVRVVIRGIVRGADGEIDYESAGFREAKQWCTVHEQEMMGWDVEDWPGDMEWAWLGPIHNFMPLFRSCVEFDGYFCALFHVWDEDEENYFLTVWRDLLTAVGLNPDTDRQRCLDFLHRYANRMIPFFLGRLR